MGAIDEASEVVGNAVEARWREKIYAVVTPAEPPREIGYRQDLDDSYSQTGEFVEFSHSRRPHAFSRERPDVHFIKDLTAWIHAAPVLIGPFETFRIDD